MDNNSEIETAPDTEESPTTERSPVSLYSVKLSPVEILEDEFYQYFETNLELVSKACQYISDAPSDIKVGIYALLMRVNYGKFTMPADLGGMLEAYKEKVSNDKE